MLWALASLSTACCLLGASDSRLAAQQEDSGSLLPRGLTRMLGLPLISGGVLLGGWTYRMMRRANTPITGEPFVAGKPTTSLVTQGPFRYTRNPGYLGAAMVYAGIASLPLRCGQSLLLP